MPENLDNEPYEKLIKLDFLEKNEIHFFLFGPNFPVFIESIKSDWDDEVYLRTPLREAVEKLIALVDEYIDNAVQLGELTISSDMVDRYLFTSYTPLAIPVKGKGHALIQVLTRLRTKNFPIQEDLIKNIENSEWEKGLSRIPELQRNMLALSKKIEQALGKGKVELQPIVDKFFSEQFKAESNTVRKPEDKGYSLGTDKAGEVDSDGAGAKPKQDWNKVKKVALNVWGSNNRDLKIVDIYNHENVQEALDEGKPVTQKYVETKISKWINGVKKEEDNAPKNDTQKGRKLKLSKR